MTIHATSLEQFMLGRQMDSEIKRQKSLPPRWAGLMIFKTPTQAGAYVTNLYASEGRGQPLKAWLHARDIVAMTYDLYCNTEEAAKIAKWIVAMLTNQKKPELPASLIISGNAQEIELTVLAGDDQFENRFVLLEEQYVPIPW